MSKPLQGKTIIDLSHRLPGPMAGKLLADMGAKVIKIEDEKFKDPFIHGLFAEMDNSFPIWYENINKNKEVLRLNFNSEDDQRKIQELCFNADGIILAIPPKVQAKLGIELEKLKANERVQAIVLPKASKEGLSHMHDLNALAISGLLTLHAKTTIGDEVHPPFLPIAGINFGQKMAFDLLATLLKSTESKSVEVIESFLFESTMDVYGPFYTENLREHDRFLHNGLYPCYNLYKTADGDFIAMACVEEKFWQSFVELFDLSFSMDERFDTTGKIYNELKDYILGLSTKDFSSKLGQADICINILKSS